MTKFRGCIDIHSGQVKQIVGGTLTEDDTISSTTTKENFVSNKPSSYYSELYKKNSIFGCHVIKLGSNLENDKVAKLALETWKENLQIGGGINYDNALEWLNNGASHVILTSWLFSKNEKTEIMEFDFEKLKKISELIGKNKLIVDLSCRTIIKDGKTFWYVAMNKWQTITNNYLSKEFLEKVGEYCDEFLIHAADVEGLCKGIDEELIKKLSDWCPVGFEGKIVYAGGAKLIDDLNIVKRLSNGKIDLTYGSSLDIFSGDLVKFQDLVDWNKQQ